MSAGGGDARGLLDTSAIIALEYLDAGLLPREASISAVTLAELAVGPHATQDATERARRQERLQRVEATLHPLPFDDVAARAYGRVYAATKAVARKPRGARVVDLLIAASAVAHGLSLYTRNPVDVEHLEAIGLVVRPV